jgi:hypothetical protein
LPRLYRKADALLRTPISRTLLLAAACLLAITPFFVWGSPSGHDFEFHMFSWMEVLGQWQHGIIYPRWAALAHWGYGEARFLFYPPASWTLGAALGAILPWRMVPGAYCWIVLALAGAAMYRLAREYLPVPDALFAAVFYALNPYHLLIVYWRSAYAELMAAPLLPLLLLCLLRSNTPAFRSTLWLSLTFAVAWLTNLPLAVIIHYSAAGLAVIMVGREAARQRSWDLNICRPLIRTALAMLFGAGLASFYLIPAIYEQRWINLSEVLSPGVRPQDNFLFTTLPDPDHNRFNLLLSTIALAELVVLAVAIWFSLRKKRSANAVTSVQDLWPLVAVWGTASAGLMLSASNVLWQHLPKLRFVQLPFRWLLCMNAALAMLLTMAAKSWRVRALASVILLAVVLIAGYRIQPPWWDRAADIREMSNALADSTGYEGADEYVPAGADPSELKKDYPRVADSSGQPRPSQMIDWGLLEKHFVVSTSSRESLTLRLFTYPAWDVTVNGKHVQTQSTDVTSQMTIPVTPGKNDIRIRFTRTRDRTIGGIVSLVSMAMFIIVWIMARRSDGRRANTPPLDIETSTS